MGTHVACRDVGHPPSNQERASGSVPYALHTSARHPLDSDENGPCLFRNWKDSEGLPRGSGVNGIYAVHDPESHHEANGVSAIGSDGANVNENGGDGVNVNVNVNVGDLTPCSEDRASTLR